MTRNFLALCCLSIVLSSCDKRQDEIFIISEQYRGPFVIVFGVSNAPNTPRENGARVYQVPEDGILVIREDIIKQPHELAFFARNVNGNRTQLKWTPFLNDSSDEVLVRGGKSGTALYSGGDSNSQEIASGRKGVFTYVSFVVGDARRIPGSSNQIDSLLAIVRQRLREQVRSD